MFPSGGYFRGINCPFYSSGLCERAYCHYRHVKTEEEKPLGRSGSYYGNNLSDKPWNGPTSSSKTYSTDSRPDEIQINKYTGEPIKSDPHQDVSVSEKINIYTGLPETNTIHEEYSVEFNHKNVTENKYKPQTLHSRKKNAGKPVEYNKYSGEPIFASDNVSDDCHDDASEDFPEYNPTPIDRLKRNSIGSKQKYTSGNPCTVSEQEYDPESNFSSSNSGRHAIKRTYSYDPTNPDFSHPIKKARDSGYEFDISKFSDDEDEEEGENEKEEVGEDDKDKFPVIRDVKYFESLLINHRENGEQKCKTVHNNSDKNSTRAVSSVKKFKNNETCKKSSKKITDHSHCSDELKKSDLDSASKSKSKKSSKDLISSGKNSQISLSFLSKTNICSKNEKSKGSNSSHSSSHSEKKTSTKSHSNKHSGHSASSEKSSSSTNDKSLKDKHHSSSSKSSKSNASSSLRASSSSKDKSGGKEKSSTKNKSHSNENLAKTNSSSGDGKSHKSKERKHSSDSQGKNGNILDKHKAKSKHHSSEHKRERTISSESDSAKKKILNINVNLFGEDSDTASVGNAGDSCSSDDDLISVSDLEDVDAYEECLKIFNEHVTSKPSPKKKSKTKEPEQDEHNATGKKRFAHKTDTQVTRKAPEKPVYKPSPAQVMHNRLLHMQKKALEEAEKSKAVSSLSSSSSSANKNPTKESVKKREAHKPLIGSGTKVVDGKTVMATASKVQKRKAHTPNVSNLKRPTIPAEFGSKVPTNVRQRYLNAMIDECLKACDNEEKAFKRGQEEELAVYKRSTSKTVYLNVACNTIKRIRTEAAENLPSGSKKAPQSVMKLSHEAMLGGKKAVTNSYTLNRSGGSHKLQVENFSGAELYKRLMRYILTEEQLTENGFPRPDPEDPSKVLMSSENAIKNKKANLKAYEKVCVRCGKKFEVYPNGTYANKEECVYHWGKAWKKKIAGYIDSRYTCCQGDLGAEGCQVGKYHVHEANKWENLTGYMKTLPCSPTLDGDYGVYAMDCEMVYTQGGLELARVTVTDSGNATVYETLIRPDRKVIDYNTRFSGITEEDMKGVVSTLRDAQAVLLSLFTEKTILIGHSLESDLSAIKLIHNTVVDTSVVFPHRLGPPYKRALKTLMAEYLQKIIQDDVGGHDSQEDAISCMELMQWRLKEDARKEPRRST